MRKSVSLLVFLTILCPAKGQNSQINLDSVELIRIIDHQNFNFEWYCGRVFEITRNDGKFEMHLVEQYSRSFFFGEPVVNLGEDSIDIAKSLLITELDINKDSATQLANNAITSRHSFWASMIRVENTKEPKRIDQFNEKQLLQLIDAMNDVPSRSQWKILDNLGMDSIWISQNAPRLFETYGLEGVKPTQEQREFCLSCFVDRKKRLIAGYTLIGKQNISDYPYIEIQIFEPWNTSMRSRS